MAYPEALSHLPAPHFWSIIFFLMLFLLGLDSAFALFETFLCSVFDAFPFLRSHKFLVTSSLSFLCFLLGLPCVTEGGHHVLHIMDSYGASVSVLIVALMELVAIMWGYGVTNFCLDIETMLGFYPNIYFRVSYNLLNTDLI